MRWLTMTVVAFVPIERERNALSRSLDSWRLASISHGAQVVASDEAKLESD